MSLEDVEAIKQVKARYFRLMDTKDWDGLAGVFTDDVVMDITSEGMGLVTNVAEYMPFLIGVLGDVTTVHHGHMPEIELTSATTARAIWAFEDELWWPEGAPLRYMHGYGHYHETYEKSADGWRIKTMTITRLQRLVETAPPTPSESVG
jgi:SnoaL-like domain